MPSQMHLVFISPLQSLVSKLLLPGLYVWRECLAQLECLLGVTACGLLQTAEAQLPGVVLAFEQVLCLVWGVSLWTQKQQRAVIPSSWYSSYCAACFPASCSLYSFPKWLQTGSNYLRNIVSRMISVLLTFSQSWETKQVPCSARPSITSACVRPVYCQPSVWCSSAIITSLSLHFPSPCLPVSHQPPSHRSPLRSPRRPLSCSPLPGAAPARPLFQRAALSPAAAVTFQAHVEPCVLREHAPLHVSAQTQPLINFWPLLSPLPSLAEPMAGLYARV